MANRSDVFGGEVNIFIGRLCSVHEALENNVLTQRDIDCGCRITVVLPKLGVQLGPTHKKMYVL